MTLRTDPQSTSTAIMDRRTTRTAFCRHELKFALTPEECGVVKRWAQQHMSPDGFAADGVYRISTLYLDTRHLDVYHKVLEGGGTKYRVRRYGDESVVYLERKVRKGSLVRKRRAVLPLSKLSRVLRKPLRTGDWVETFSERVRDLRLAPTLLVSYDRSAWTGPQNARLTIDENIQGWRGEGLARMQGPPDGRGDLVPDAIVLELKYDHERPRMFEDLMALLGRDESGFSKYGRSLQAAGMVLVPQIVPHA